MRSMPQFAAWWCFVPSVMTSETFVRTMADIGYAAVDLPPEEHWPLIKQHGLAISAIGGHRSLTAGLNRRDLHDDIAAEVEANLHLAG